MATTIVADRPEARVAKTRRERRRTVTFTEVGIDPNRIEDPRSPRNEEYGPFEGPRLSYSLLLGESPTWSGPESLVLRWDEGQELCRFCHQYAKMPAYAYCLACDRAGRAHLIPPAPLRARVSRRRDARLRGGIG